MCGSAATNRCRPGLRDGEYFRVAGVSPAGAAEKAGLIKGDVLLAANNIGLVGANDAQVHLWQSVIVQLRGSTGRSAGSTADSTAVVLLVVLLAVPLIVLLVVHGYGGYDQVRLGQSVTVQLRFCYYSG